MFMHHKTVNHVCKIVARGALVIICLFLICFFFLTLSWKGEKAIDYVSKRGVLDFLNFEIKFRLEAPGVDWVRKIGSEDIGASFGVIMENLLDLKIGKTIQNINHL